MSGPGPPSAEEQLAFLRSLQRLLDEGSFVASYKFALLRAIADLCLLNGDDSGRELDLSTSEIAEQFVRLYWRQVAPFAGGAIREVLRQNTGRQAAIVRELAERYDRYQGSIAALERSPAEWERLRRSVEATVRRMPLWKLQTVGSERLEFLYENRDSGDTVRLAPGVAYCFRAFYTMVSEMVESAWCNFVHRLNPDLLGQVVDLRSFLFGSPRGSLTLHRPLLRDLQEGRCFYCDREIRTGGAVDHFIPWRRYSLELGHNFVLAHQGCNSSKSDVLAAEEHLERWTERSLIHRHELETGFGERHVPHDWPKTRSIARWAYGQVERAKGQVWVGKGELRPLSEEWRRILWDVHSPS